MLGEIKKSSTLKMEIEEINRKLLKEYTGGEMTLEMSNQARVLEKKKKELESLYALWEEKHGQL